ncbi:hypothetical protein PF005_g13502 [Phytophthora fragariae]|uniref:RxLR effector protein n=1 Tax=Phytophthora fragariae TaxID=53985 RepID=A0A6A3KGM6_9STRA|nr:hypothetical protein PF003_g23084 [Phytophthora fragariae]KAE8936670.1 hypothetical protein PF009_g13411 [Phytophthora fragariae]KAE9005792.1 hypothetical protein PF011_g11886 [Phytophthora fragariae]KAE9104472.1 hypothetical protein PF007_g14051 [Phytophthora fragariae]KAE9144947.1 hypothetical protein PF006_g10160 [Phytophthora fragariae]
MKILGLAALGLSCVHGRSTSHCVLGVCSMVCVMRYGASTYTVSPPPDFAAADH